MDETRTPSESDQAQAAPLLGDGRPLDAVRPLRAGERAQAAQLLGVPEAWLDHGLRVVVDDAGPAAGVAAWRADQGAVAELGGIVLSALSTGPRDLYELVRGCAIEALAAGFTLAAFTLYDRALLRRLDRTFTITAEPFAFAPLSPEDERMGLPRVPVAWRVEVDLADALAQLDKVLGP